MFGVCVTIFLFAVIYRDGTSCRVYGVMALFIILSIVEQWQGDEGVFLCGKSNDGSCRIHLQKGVEFQTSFLVFNFTMQL